MPNYPSHFKNRTNIEVYIWVSVIVAEVNVYLNWPTFDLAAHTKMLYIF